MFSNPNGITRKRGMSPGRSAFRFPERRPAGEGRSAKCGFSCHLFCRAEYFVYICRLKNP